MEEQITSALRYVRTLQLGVRLRRAVRRLISIGDNHRAGLVVLVRGVRVVLVAGGQRFHLVKDQRTVRGGHLRTDQKGLLGGGCRNRATLRYELVAVHRLRIAEERRCTCRVVGRIVAAERRSSRSNNRRSQCGLAAEERIRIGITQA